MEEDFLLSGKQSLYDGGTFLKMLTENSEIQKNVLRVDIVERHEGEKNASTEHCSEKLSRKKACAPTQAFRHTHSTQHASAMPCDIMAG